MLTLSPTLRPHFKGFCSSAEIIMLFVYMKSRFSLSYRELEEMMMIRGVEIDHSTLQRWGKVRRRKKAVNDSWRIDETYIKLNGKWVYLYRAVDSQGNTIDFLLRPRRNAIAAKAFLKKSLRKTVVLRK